MHYPLVCKLVMYRPKSNKTKRSEVDHQQSPNQFSSQQWTTVLNTRPLLTAYGQKRYNYQKTLVWQEGQLCQTPPTKFLDWEQRTWLQTIQFHPCMKGISITIHQVLKYILLGVAHHLVIKRIFQQMLLTLAKSTSFLKFNISNSTKYERAITITSTY